MEQYFTVMLFVFQLYPVCNFGKFINSTLDLGLEGKGLKAPVIMVLLWHPKCS